MNLHSNFPAELAELDTNASTRTSAPVESQVLTMEKLAAVIAAIPPEPIREFMIGRGCNPDDGWLLMLPKGHEMDQGSLPRYVIVSANITEPVLVNSPMLRKQSAWEGKPWWQKL